MVKKILIIIMLLITCFGLNSCKNKNTKNKEEKNTIKIGAILPFTGELSSYADPMKEGIEIAVDEINKKNEEKIEIIYGDSKGEAKTGVSILNKFININKIKYIIGDISSSVTLSMVPICENKNVFLFSPGASSPKLTGLSQYFARNYPSSLYESIAAARYAFNDLKKDSCIIVYVNNEYGLGLKNKFIEEYKKNNGRIIKTFGYQYEKRDYKNIISKIKTIEHNCIYLAGNQKEMGYFMKQYKEQKLNKTIISNISFLENACLNIAGNAANDVIVPVPYYNPKDTSKNIKQFTMLYKNKFKRSPSIANAIGYDNVNILYDAISKKGMKPIEVSKYIRNLKNYKGAIGKIRFENGDVIFPIVFKKVTNGEVINVSNPIYY